jgi:hypothetical protein
MCREEGAALLDLALKEYTLQTDTYCPNRTDLIHEIWKVEAMTGILLYALFEFANKIFEDLQICHKESIPTSDCVGKM